MDESEGIWRVVFAHGGKFQQLSGDWRAAWKPNRWKERRETKWSRLAEFGDFSPSADTLSPPSPEITNGERRWHANGLQKQTDRRKTGCLLMVKQSQQKGRLSSRQTETNLSHHVKVNASFSCSTKSLWFRYNRCCPITIGFFFPFWKWSE